jgi:hypothetical protein
MSFLFTEFVQMMLTVSHLHSHREKFLAKDINKFISHMKLQHGVNVACYAMWVEDDKVLFTR